MSYDNSPPPWNRPLSCCQRICSYSFFILRYSLARIGVWNMVGRCLGFSSELDIGLTAEEEGGVSFCGYFYCWRWLLITNCYRLLHSISINHVLWWSPVEKASSFVDNGCNPIVHSIYDFLICTVEKILPGVEDSQWLMWNAKIKDLLRLSSFTINYTMNRDDMAQYHQAIDGTKDESLRVNWNEDSGYELVWGCLIGW